MTVIDAVVIGRNEGPRLIACLASLTGSVRRVVYVDSGSTDGSATAAAALGAEVVALDMRQPFTAARARNAGLDRLAADPPDLVQMVDGDCEVQPGWITTARSFLADRPDIAVVCGRRRERRPGDSVYNRLCDAEWDMPVGAAAACGGDALMRYAPLRDVGGYDPALIAGEEPDLCLRLRRAGWGIWRLEAEMTLHDAALLRFGQWWRRTRRAGHAFAEGDARYGAGPERHWRRETRRALVWGAGVPLAAGLAAVLHPAGLLILLAWPLQALRLLPRLGAEGAVFSVIGKIAEAQGAIGFYLGRLRGRRRGIIEYK